MSIAQDPDMPGYEAFEKEAWGFKVSVTTIRESYVFDGVPLNCGPSTTG